MQAITIEPIRLEIPKGVTGADFISAVKKVVSFDAQLVEVSQRGKVLCLGQRSSHIHEHILVECTPCSVEIRLDEMYNYITVSHHNWGYPVTDVLYQLNPQLVDVTLRKFANDLFRELT